MSETTDSPSMKYSTVSSSPVVLSLFPGIGLLDMAFEECGFAVLRGPDKLWGGDVKDFNPPGGIFDGVIGGPPCQAHSRYAGINRKLGNKIAEDLVPEFLRVVKVARPRWWLMENVPDVPDVRLDGYQVTRTILDNRWFGEEQSRRRAFQFGTSNGLAIDLPDICLENPIKEPVCLASEGRGGRISFKNGKSKYNSRRSFGKFCELQGLPSDFLAGAPLTTEGKFRVVGNGVPLPMGRHLANSIREKLYRENGEFF